MTIAELAIHQTIQPGASQSYKASKSKYTGVIYHKQQQILAYVDEIAIVSRSKV